MKKLTVTHDNNCKRCGYPLTQADQNNESTICLDCILCVLDDSDYIVSDHEEAIFENDLFDAGYYGVEYDYTEVNDYENIHCI